MSTKDTIFQRTEAGLKAFLAPALVTTPIVRPNPALLAGKASVDAFADKMLANERALEKAARQAMLKDAFSGVPGFVPTDCDLKRMADIEAEKHSEGHIHRNTREQRHE